MVQVKNIQKMEITIVKKKIIVKSERGAEEKQQQQQKQHEHIQFEVKGVHFKHRVTETSTSANSFMKFSSIYNCNIAIFDLFQSDRDTLH